MLKINSKDYFPNSKKIPDELFLIGNLNNAQNKRIAIVGSRRPSLYGKMVVEKIIRDAKGLPISIVSGLALGIDSMAHEMALKYGVHTIGIPGSSLDNDSIYPRSNLVLANRIIENGGALLSPWENQKATMWTFPFRNSVMASISDFVLIIEATEDGGTMITAREAIKRNIKLGAIPGNIDNLYSAGPNSLIKNGAKLVTELDDILNEINLVRTNIQNKNISDNIILRHLKEPCHRDNLGVLTGLNASDLSVELTMLEISNEINIDANGIIRLT